MSIITKFKIFERISSREELLSNSLKKDGLVEPALMTSKEYLEYLEALKSHPDDAYQFSLKDDSVEISDEKLKEKFTLLNTIKHGSIYVKYYIDNGSGFKNNQYVKHGEDGEIMRDDNQMAVLMTKDEIAKAGYTYDRNVIAVHDNKTIGSAQDEWGCVLVYVVKELKGIGIGQQLTTFYRSYYPNKTSGGTTSGGYHNLKKYHKSQIKLYSRNGIYSDMVRNKEITYDRVKEIIDSVSSIKTNDRKKGENIYSKYYNDSKDYNRVFLFGGNDIMMINENIIEYYKDYSKKYKEVEDTYEDFIFGHTRMHPSDDGKSVRLYFLDGKTEKDIIELIGYAMCYVNMKYGLDTLIYYVTENTADLTKDVVVNKLRSELYEAPNRYKIKLDNIDKELINKLKEDTFWFYKLDDKYDQIKTQITENVYSAFDN
jgi:hypothetical protein